MIARNHTGHRIGEGHHRAKLTDDQVREMRRQHEQNGVSRPKVAAMFGVSYWTARDILEYRTRWAT